MIVHFFVLFCRQGAHQQMIYLNFSFLFLKLLIENEYTVHNSFSFVKEVSSKNLMISLGVESLFTIPLEGTIDKIINDLFLTTESS